MNVIDAIIRYESGELSQEETRALFEELVSTGQIFELQGHYQRTARDLGLLFPLPTARSSDDTDFLAEAPRRAEYPSYVVTLRFQYPAWDEVDGIPYQIEARSKSEAINRARRQARDDGHLYGGKGRVSFKAVPVED